jgi:cytochrome c oxidase accessory protein FixG
MTDVSASRPYHRARRAVGLFLLAAFLALPFLRMGGESVLRFDLPGQRLHVFGATVWMQDFFLLLVALFALVFAAIFLTIEFGRIWCGWACPQTVLVDLTGFIGRRGGGGVMATSGKDVLGTAVAWLLAALLGAAVSAAAIGYFVSPWDIGALFGAGGRAPGIVTGIWAVLALVIALDLGFLRRRFCAKACPYAKLQGILFDDRTMVVAFDEARAGECMKCAACAKACPMGIDIRDGSQVECIHCAECVDACTGKMARRGLPTLVRYTRGQVPAAADGAATSDGAAASKGVVRVPMLITGILSVAFVALLAFMMASRPPFEAEIHPAQAANALVTASGAVAVPCVLSLRNLSRSDLEFVLTATSTAGTVILSRDRFSLAADGEALKASVTLVIQEVADASRPLPVVVEFRSAGSPYVVKDRFAATQRPRK